MDQITGWWPCPPPTPTRLKVMPLGLPSPSFPPCQWWDRAKGHGGVRNTASKSTALTSQENANPALSSPALPLTTCLVVEGRPRPWPLLSATRAHSSPSRRGRRQGRRRQGISSYAHAASGWGACIRRCASIQGRRKNGFHGIRLTVFNLSKCPPLRLHLSNTLA